MNSEVLSSLDGDRIDYLLVFIRVVSDNRLIAHHITSFHLEL